MKERYIKVVNEKRDKNKESYKTTFKSSFQDLLIPEKKGIRLEPLIRSKT